MHSAVSSTESRLDTLDLDFFVLLLCRLYSVLFCIYLHINIRLEIIILGLALEEELCFFLTLAEVSLDLCGIIAPQWSQLVTAISDCSLQDTGLSCCRSFLPSKMINQHA